MYAFLVPGLGPDPASFIINNINNYIFFEFPLTNNWASFLQNQSMSLFSFA